MNVDYASIEFTSPRAYGDELCENQELEIPASCSHRLFGHDLCFCAPLLLVLLLRKMFISQ